MYVWTHKMNRKHPNSLTVVLWRKGEDRMSAAVEGGYHFIRNILYYLRVNNISWAPTAYQALLRREPVELNHSTWFPCQVARLLVRLSQGGTSQPLHIKGTFPLVITSKSLWWYFCFMAMTPFSNNHRPFLLNEQIQQGLQNCTFPSFPHSLGAVPLQRSTIPLKSPLYPPLFCFLSIAMDSWIFLKLILS